MSSSSSSSSGGPYIEWKAWPGGQSDQDLNPTEKFESTDFGLEGNVDWDVGQGAVHVEAKIIKTDGTPVDPPVTTASNCSSITVRYETRSPSAAEVDTAWIQATKNAVTKTKKRTVFEANWTQPKFTGELESDLRFEDKTGPDPDHCGFYWPSPEDQENGKEVAGKMEATLTIEPDTIDWAARGVTWTFSENGASGKSHARLHRKTRRTAVGEAVAAGSRRKVQENDANWIYDGDSDEQDAQNPTPSVSKAFRIDNPGFKPPDWEQMAMRADFRDIVEWHDGTGWCTITPTTNALWHFNGTSVLDPENPGDPGIQGGENSHGSGIPAGKVPNQRPVAVATTLFETYQPGDRVDLWGNESSDDDHDELTYEWTQTAGPEQLELLAGSGPDHTMCWPQKTGEYTFSLKVRDITKDLHYHKPDPENYESQPDTVTFTVEESSSSSGG